MNEEWHSQSAGVPPLSSLCALGTGGVFRLADRCADLPPLMRGSVGLTGEPADNHVDIRHALAVRELGYGNGKEVVFVNVCTGSCRNREFVAHEIGGALFGVNAIGLHRCHAAALWPQVRHE